MLISTISTVCTSSRSSEARVWVPHSLVTSRGRTLLDSLARSSVIWG